MRDVASIIWRNFRQPIVIGILILALTLFILGEKRDAWFVSVVIIINTVFAVVQEIRARYALHKLELMSAPRARRINSDGTVSDISYDELAVDDRIDIRTGDEVPADGVVVSSHGLETNESMLTGESASVTKDAKADVYASSSVVAGSAIVTVTAVGNETRVGGMTKTLRRYVPQQTPLQRSIARIISAMTFGALILAALIFVVYSLLDTDPIVIFKTITSAAVTVVPEGLLLASTLLLSFGSLRLAQAKVLPQKLAAIEAMALLRILCVDKTGTLTSDTVRFSELKVWRNARQPIAELIGITALETSSGNATGDAMIAGLPRDDAYTLDDRLAFSSERKYSGVRVTYRKKSYTMLVGAPEFLSDISPLTAAQRSEIRDYTAHGQRVLLVVQVKQPSPDLKHLPPKSGTSVGVVILSNELRPGVTKTVQYLQKNGVSIRVISGDSPDTVKYVATEAGIARPTNVITGAELAKLSPAKWRAAAQKNTIFSRVLPEQKEQLVQYFRDKGNFTGMVGDGVNDALALKKADLGVAMFAGATATRRIADIVLLNNSFNALPMGMRLGNRIMLTIEMIATLFFHKIIYGIVLLLTTISLGVIYPFAPRHVTFMNIFLVTMPTILWTLFSPLPTYKVSPKHFWKDTLLPILPIAMITGIVVALSYLRLSSLHPDDPEGVATTTVLIATLFGIYLVFLMGKLFRAVNNRTQQLARLLYILGVILVVVVSFGFGVTRDFFDFTAPSAERIWPLILLIMVALLLQWLIVDRVAKLKKQANRRVETR